MPVENTNISLPPTNASKYRFCGQAAWGLGPRNPLVVFFQHWVRRKEIARVAPGFKLIHGAKPYPYLDSKATGTPPSVPLNLQPGDLVEVKSKEEIFETLDERDRTRDFGLMPRS